jgi:hypothetical protein
VKAWNAHDMDALAELVDERVDFIPNKLKEDWFHAHAKFDGTFANGDDHPNHGRAESSEFRTSQ